MVTRNRGTLVQIPIWLYSSLDDLGPSTSQVWCDDTMGGGSIREKMELRCTKNNNLVPIFSTASIR